MPARPWREEGSGGAAGQAAPLPIRRSGRCAEAGRGGRGRRGGIASGPRSGPPRRGQPPSQAARGRGRGRGLGGRPRPHRAAAPFDDMGLGGQKQWQVPGARGLRRPVVQRYPCPCRPLALPPRGKAISVALLAFRRRAPAPSAIYAPGQTLDAGHGRIPDTNARLPVGSHVCIYKQRRPTARL